MSSAGLQLLIGDGFQKGEADAILDRLRVRLEIEERNIGVGLEPLGQGRVLGRDQEPAAGQMSLNGVPVEMGLGNQDQGVGRQLDWYKWRAARSRPTVCTGSP